MSRSTFNPPFSMLNTLGVLALAGSLAASCGRSSRPEERRVVVTISGAPIYVDEFKHELKRIRVDDQDGVPAAGSEEAQKRALLDNLIDRRLLVQEAERANVIVGTDEVDAAFARSRSGWDEEEFNTELSQKDLTPTEFKAELREILLIRRYFREHVFSRVAVTDQEIEAYMTAHPETLLVPERVRAKHIVLKTEEEAQRVLGEIKAGLAFEDAAMKYSQSPDGKNGGDLGVFARAVMPRVFDEVCFSQPVGQVSKVVAGDDGFYIFRVIEKLPQQARSPEGAREEVETLLRREKERATQEAKTEELRKAAVIHIQEEQLARIH